MTVTCSKIKIFLLAISILLYLLINTGCVSATNQPVILATPLLTPTASPLSITPTSVTTKCKDLFKEISDITKNSKQIEDNLIVSKLLQNGELFLNICTNPNQPLSVQANNLNEFRQASTVNYPPNLCESTPDFPTIQLIDLNNDERDELLLHTQVRDCLVHTSDRGGLSLLFFWDDLTEKWQGSMIWPPVEQYNYADQNYFTQPMVQPLSIPNSHGHPFMIVVGKLMRADSIPTFIDVWRWENSGPKLVTEIEMDGWCYPEKWEITPEGHILITPIPSESSRCGEPKSRNYVLRDDKFVLETD